VRNVAKKGGVLVGFHEKSSSYVADMCECRILPKKISDMLVPMRELTASLTIADRMPQIEVAVGGDGRIALVMRVLETPSEEDLRQFDAFALEHGVDIWLQPKGPDSCYPMHKDALTALKLELTEFGVFISFKPTDFTQVNHRLNETMVSRAINLLDVHPDHKVADFFCGLGNFTLPLAVRSQKVIGIEGSDQLVERARAGAADNGLAEKTEFVARNLFTWCEEDWDKLWNQMGGIDRVLIDPPREGALELARTLAATDKRPARIVYVSCNPATLARDCAVLHHEGGWKIRSAGVMNMFPHTGHVESMAVLEPGPKPEKKAEVVEETAEESAQAEA
jgi:23S rRNA (uracil1939-C5)-methyltransferase